MQSRSDCPGNDAFLSRSGASADPGETRKKLRGVSRCSRRAGEHRRTLGVVHSPGGGHALLAGEAPHHSLQDLDAERTRALVARALAGLRNLLTLVCSQAVSLIS